MAVTIDTILTEYYAWDSYPYETWGGDEYKTWGSSGVCTFELTDKEDISCKYAYISHKTFDDATETFDNDNRMFADGTIKKTFTKNRRENFKTTEAFSKIIDAKRTYIEPINILETPIKRLSRMFLDSFSIMQSGYHNSVGANKKENVSIKDKTNRHFLATQHDTLAVSDVINHQAEFTRSFDTVIGVEEFPYRTYNRYDSEYFDITDYEFNSFNKIPTEPINLAELFSRKTITKRSYADNIGIADLAIKDYQRYSYEQCAISDRYLKPFLGTYSNLLITEGEFSDDDFAQAINTVQGYTDFIDFKVGEYDYQEALVRVSLSSNTQAQPTAAGITLHVDIPDTDDRGSVVIAKTDSATQVPFNKSYYIIPEVQVTLRSASTSSGVVTPNITDVTTKYFEVELLTSGGTRTTGTISWASKGY